MKMIDNKELEEIGYIENPQEIIVEYVNRKDSEYPNLTIDQFEKELIKKYHFKATKDTEDLYYYDSENGIYVKGGDYTRDTLPEVSLVEELGGIVKILPYVDNRSTTRLIHHIQAIAK